jgi:hypothetical protein
MTSIGTFRYELKRLINKCSQENGSDTPDFILAEYLTNCLEAFDVAVIGRERWYGRKPSPETVPKTINPDVEIQK